MKKVKVDDVIKYCNDELNCGSVGVSRDDFKDGSGVYGIFVGSRGYIDEIYKVENFKLRSKEEIIEEMLFGSEDEDGSERDYLEEFCGSGEIDWNDFGGVYEGLNEEESIEYYNVVV
jgi:hypothetical protein